MRFLFIANRSSGILAPLAKWLAAKKENEAYFGLGAFRHGEDLPGVKKIRLRGADKAPKPENVLDQWRDALSTAKRTAGSLSALNENNLAPDIIFNISVNGAALCLPMVFPKAFSVHLVEPFPATGPFHDLLQSVMIQQADLAYSTSRYMAKKLHTAIKTVPFAIDDEFFRPGPEQGENIVISLLNIHPMYANAWINLARELARPVKIILPFRSLARELPAGEDISFAIRPDPREYREILQSASIFVCPGQQNELPADLLQAMSCSLCCLTNLKSSLLVNGQNYMRLSPKKVRASIREALCARTIEIGRNARKDVVARFGMESVLPGFYEEILAQMNERRQRL